MLKRMLYKISCVDPKPLETITAVQSISWGMWLLLPMNTFSASGTYSVMGLLASEEFWGILFVVLGVSQIVSMRVFSVRLRGMIATAMMFSWIFVDLGFWLSGSTSAAAITYSTFALASIWSVVALSGRTRNNCREDRH